jgi:hypothetical protein
MQVDEDVLYGVIKEAVLALGLRIDYWESEEVAEAVIRKLEEITLLRARHNPTHSTRAPSGNPPSG